MARSAAGLASGWVCSAKIAERISLIVSSSASTDRLTRSATSGTVIIDVTPCSDMPVAYSRWMTRSCRSLAIRSRSSKTAICSACLRCSASSSPMAAWAAKVASMSAAAWDSGMAPGRRPADRTPRTLPGAPSGTTSSGPIASLAFACSLISSSAWKSGME